MAVVAVIRRPQKAFPSLGTLRHDAFRMCAHFPCPTILHNNFTRAFLSARCTCNGLMRWRRRKIVTGAARNGRGLHTATPEGKKKRTLAWNLRHPNCQAIKTPHSRCRRLRLLFPRALNLLGAFSLCRCHVRFLLEKKMHDI